MNALEGALPSTVIGKSNNPNDIEFLLFADPSNKNECSTLVMNEIGSLPQPPSDYIKTTKVLIPGLDSHALSDFPQDVKDAYLENPEGPNVIIVNWGRLASPSWIPCSESIRMETVGRRVGEFLNWLIDSTRLNPLNVHIVGHSAGCHIAGLAGSIMTGPGGNLGRISALDPTRSGCLPNIFNRELNENHAEFVDAYYMNATVLGACHAIGGVNFYINEDPTRANCTSNSTDEATPLTVHTMFSQTILDGPGRNNVTEQALKSDENNDFVVSNVDRDIILGEHCIPGTVGRYDIKY